MVLETAHKKSPRGKGPKNRFGFRHGTKAALVSDLIGARPMSMEALQQAISAEFGHESDDQFRSLIDFVMTKMRKQGFVLKQERVLSVLNGVHILGTSKLVEE